jgi:hypothetical protein
MLMRLTVGPQAALARAAKIASHFMVFPSEEKAVWRAYRVVARGCQEQMGAFHERYVHPAPALPAENPGLGPRGIVKCLAPVAVPEYTSKMTREAELAAVEEARAAQNSDALWDKTRSGDREVRKAAKRALFLLRARGVSVGAPPAQASALPPTGQSAEPVVVEAYVSAPSPAGEQLVLVARKEPKGFRLFQGVISEVRGLAAFDHLDASRRLLRTILADLTNRGAAVRAIDGARALGLLAEAVAIDPNGPAALRAARDITELAEHAPPRAAKEPDPTEQDRAALAASASLFDDVALQGYLPDLDFLRETAVRLD